MEASKKNIRKKQKKEKVNDSLFTVEFVTRMCNSKKFTKDEILSSLTALSKSVKPEDLTDKENQVLEFVFAEKKSALLSYLDFETKEEFLEKFNAFFDEKNGFLEFLSKFRKIGHNLPYKHLSVSGL